MSPLLKASLSGIAALALTAVGVALPAAADTGLDWPDNPDRNATAQECAHVLFVGVRGSGEDWPYGPTVQRIRDLLQERTRDTPGGQPRATVREIALDYPATSPYSLTDIGVKDLLFANEIPDNDYLDSVAVGRAELDAILTDSETRCPTERWVLVGFSQGAEVINEVLAQRGPSPQLAGALLFGNPLHHPSQGGTELGSADQSATGLVAVVQYLRETARVSRGPEDEIGLRAVIRATLELAEDEVNLPRMQRVAREELMELPQADRVVSVCDDGDMICDAGTAMARVMLGASTITEEADQARPIHMGYDDDIIDEATAALIDDLLENLPDEVPVEPEPADEDEAPVGLIAGGVGLLGLLSAGGALLTRSRRRNRSSSPESEERE